MRIAIFIFEEMTDYEITFVMHLLAADAGYDIKVVAYNKDTLIKGKSGLVYKANYNLDEMDFNEIDGIIIPGGWNGDIRRELIEAINKIESNGKLVAGICGTGTVALAKSQALNNVTYTTPAISWNDKCKDIFGNENPFIVGNYIDSRVVRDKNVITAHGVAFVDFAIEICTYFNLFENEEDKKVFTKNIKG